MRASLMRWHDAGEAMPLDGVAPVQGLEAALRRWCDSDMQLCWLERPHDPVIRDYFVHADGECRLGKGWHAHWSPTQPLPLDCLPLARGRAALLKDIEYLASLLSWAAQACACSIRFDVVHGVQCPRFHVDNVKARLLCTYVGAGTQWLDERDADRSKLEHGSNGLPDEASGLIRKPGAVHTLPAFAIALLKGRQWPANEGRGAIHRSPPWSPLLGPRVLVAIDAL